MALLCYAFNDFFSLLHTDEKPDICYSDIGGMDIQKQEVREAVELPLTHFDLYKQIGIDPPRGVLMYGPPGCGKTMLAKAVAHHTTGVYINITFLTGAACMFRSTLVCDHFRFAPGFLGYQLQLRCGFWG